MFISLWLGVAVVTAIIASNRGRDPIGWFILGFLFSVFALVLVIALSPPPPRAKFVYRWTKPAPPAPPSFAEIAAIAAVEATPADSRSRQLLAAEMARRAPPPPAVRNAGSWVDNVIYVICIVALSLFGALLLFAFVVAVTS